MWARWSNLEPFGPDSSFIWSRFQISARCLYSNRVFPAPNVPGSFHMQRKSVRLHVSGGSVGASKNEKNESFHLGLWWVSEGPESFRRHPRDILRCLGTLPATSGWTSKKQHFSFFPVKCKFPVSLKFVFWIAFRRCKTLKGYIHPRWGCICPASALNSSGQMLFRFPVCSQQHRYRTWHEQTRLVRITSRIFFK